MDNVENPCGKPFYARAATDCGMHIPSYNQCRKNGAVPRGTALGLVVAKSVFSASRRRRRKCARSLAVIRAPCHLELLPCHPELFPCHPERQRRIRPPLPSRSVGEKDGFFGLRPQNDAGAGGGTGAAWPAGAPYFRRLEMTWATFTPDAPAWARPRVMPAPSPMANMPGSLVSSSGERVRREE